LTYEKATDRIKEGREMDYLCDIKARQIADKIKKGGFGRSGEQFMTVRQLAEAEGISLVTAHQVMSVLKNLGLVEYYKKKNYLTFEQIDKKSPLGRLKKGSSRIIGVHVTNIRSPFFSALVREIEKKAATAGYRTVTATSGYDRNTEKKVLSMFRELGVSGVISTPNSPDLYKTYILPYVFTGYRIYDDLKADIIMVDNHAAGEQVAAHFIKEGYENFIYIGLSEVKNEEDPRLAGFISGLAKEGLTFKSDNIVRIGTEEIDRLYSKLSGRLSGNKTAVFCYHDLIAIEVLRICAAKGISVPEKVAVAGFDNLEISRQFSPTLTTVNYHVSKMAQKAVEILVEKIENNSEKYGRYYITPVLMVRESTKKER